MGPDSACRRTGATSRRRFGPSEARGTRTREEPGGSGTLKTRRTPLAILRYQPADSRRLFRCLGAHLPQSPYISPLSSYDADDVFTRPPLTLSHRERPRQLGVTGTPPECFRRPIDPLPAELIDGRIMTECRKLSTVLDGNFE